MANIIFDTNIYIFHSFSYPDALQIWNDNVTDKNAILLSTIQISELMSYHKVDTVPKLKKQREKYISLADRIVDVDIHIANKAAELKRSWKTHTGKSLKLPDAIIAATAIVNDAKLFSHNDRDFVFLKEHHHLDYINPIQNKENLSYFIEDIKKKSD
ncbi:PIN domain-containing protein [Shouchella shacheensis]|uniref:PIN domain-containing protein n=1 Tax=Shouchella shacheensis TaxID=1649580 RepID=UPI00074017B0|nr:PIN domain-containing protein [Shouchella shacheensis]